MTKEYPFSSYEKLYLFFVSSFLIVVVISNILSAKLLIFPFLNSLPLPAGLLTYPITFFLSDLTTEIFGQKRAKWMLNLTFLLNVFVACLIELIVKIPGHPSVDATIYTKVFQMHKLNLFGSLLAFYISQIADIRFFTFFRSLTQGKHLWLRTNGSTFLAQIIDTSIVTTIVLYQGIGLDFFLVIQIILFSYLYKISWSVISTPFFYLFVKKIRNKTDYRMLQQI